MRFNKQELLTLATQPSQKFEKEGILYVRERQEGFFRRTESESLKYYRNIKKKEIYTHIFLNFNLNLILNLVLNLAYKL